MAAFRAAAARPSLDPRASEKLDRILALPCFGDNPGRRRGGARRPRQGARNHAGGSSSQHRAARSTPALADGTPAERSIRSDLNKLAPGNYATVLRRIRLVADADSLGFLFRSGLEKAYAEPNHSRLYVRLFAETIGTMSGEARAAAFGILRDAIPTAERVREEALRRSADPVADYDAFCDACRCRRRIVGRSSTFAGLLGLPAMRESLRATPDDVYAAHEDVLRDIVGSPGLLEDPTVDAAGAVETVVESLASVIALHPGMLARFRASVEEMSVGAFPSSKSRFRVMDMLGL